MQAERVYKLSEEAWINGQFQLGSENGNYTKSKIVLFTNPNLNNLLDACA